MEATYIVPIRKDTEPVDGELASYLDQVSRWMDVVVVDGSSREMFDAHSRVLRPPIRHVVPWTRTPNGKVGNVLTGAALARHDALVIADDDVRYGREALERVVSLLATTEIVRPQNYFDPLPWHARWDTARTLLNRVIGGDWPGTLGVRRSVLQRAGGYDGNVLFENLELVRTVKATGGREFVPLDLYVRRIPPSAHHFWSQRVRQAYDELGRPLRFAISLVILPAVLVLMWMRRWRALLGSAVALAGAAEVGRRQAKGSSHFPWSASLLAPAWVLERGVCTWVALWMRIVVGGVRYRDSVIRSAATPKRKLRRRLNAIDAGTVPAWVDEPVIAGDTLR